MSYKLDDRLSDFLDKPLHHNFIHGQYTTASGKEHFDVVNPADNTQIARLGISNAQDINQAVESAQRAFQHDSPWRSMLPAQRQKILLRIADLIDEHADALAELVTLENGKLLKDSRSSDVGGAAATFRYYAGWATKIEGETLDISQKQKGERQNFAFTRRVPIGVVAAIVPWNFPLSIASWKLAPALAAGCTVVMKASEETPLSALYLAELCTKAGLPNGVFNVVNGDGPTTGDALTSHTGIQKITFTGSGYTGKLIGANAMKNLVGVSLELGGKSPAIIFDDAKDFDYTAGGVAAGIFRNQGQVCVAGSRVYIQENVFDEVLAKIAKAAEKMQIGSGFDEDAHLGPLVSISHREKVMDYVQKGTDQGAEVITGGVATGSAGAYMQPTILKTMDNDQLIVQEEIFGPVLVAIPFRDMEHAIQLANDSDLGLAATVWTSDISKAMTMIDRLEAGVIYVNSPVRSDPNLPLGGFKQSGIGRELGKVGVYNFTTLKSVNIVY